MQTSAKLGVSVERYGLYQYDTDTKPCYRIVETTMETLPTTCVRQLSTLYLANMRM